MNKKKPTQIKKTKTKIINQNKSIYDCIENDIDDKLDTRTLNYFDCIIDDDFE